MELQETINKFEDVTGLQRGNIYLWGKGFQVMRYNCWLILKDMGFSLTEIAENFKTTKPNICKCQHYERERVEKGYEYECYQELLRKMQQ